MRNNIQLPGHLTLGGTSSRTTPSLRSRYNSSSSGACSDENGLPESSQVILEVDLTGHFDVKWSCCFHSFPTKTITLIWCFLPQVTDIGMSDAPKWWHHLAASSIPWWDDCSSDIKRRNEGRRAASKRNSSVTNVHYQQWVVKEYTHMLYTGCVYQIQRMWFEEVRHCVPWNYSILQHFLKTQHCQGADADCGSCLLV